MLLSSLSLGDVHAAVAGQWRVPPASTATTCPQVVSDTRLLQPGDVFLALRGDRFDGHDFLAEALAGGASGLIVEHNAPLPPIPEKDGGPFVLGVTDTLTALGDIGAMTRRSARLANVSAIIGSSGKTTTKEMLARILEAHAGQEQVLSTTSNYNNLIGVPRMLMQFRPGHRYAVLEAGMNRAGELSRLAHIMDPHQTIVTNIGTAHRGQFATAQDHLNAKLEFLETLPARRKLLINADGSRVKEMMHAGRHLDLQFYGLTSDRSLAWAQGIEPRPGIGYRFRLVLPSGEFPIELPLFGVYNISNALAAAAAAHNLGVPGATIATALGRMKPAKMRGEWKTVAGRRVVVDCYNASPEAMTQSLYSMADVPCEGRRIAVLGDMLELGDHAPRAHRAAGQAAVAAGIQGLITVGELAMYLLEGAAHVGLKGHHVDDAKKAGELLAQVSKPGDVILLKGSRRMGLEDTLPAFEAATRPAESNDDLSAAITA